MPLFLSEHDVRATLPMADLIEAMRSALAQYSAGIARQPLRTILEVGEAQAFFGVMPATLADPPAIGTKLVTVFATNREAGLPSHLATIALLDPSTGALLAIMDGRYITEARTAAVSAVATDLLARQEASVLAILGTGVQARSHLDALGCVRALRTVRVWSPTPSHRSAFIEDSRQQTGAELIAMDSASDAVHGADIIVLATASATPVLSSSSVADGAHICAVGACRPTQREMDSALVARARTFVDSRIGAFAEAGDIVLPLQEGVISRDHIAGELGELVSGQVTGRRNPAEVTLFKSLGMAVEDVAAAHLAYTRARRLGLGSDVRM